MWVVNAHKVVYLIYDHDIWNEPWIIRGEDGKPYLDLKGYIMSKHNYLNSKDKDEMIKNFNALRSVFLSYNDDLTFSDDGTVYSTHEIYDSPVSRQNIPSVIKGTKVLETILEYIKESSPTIENRNKSELFENPQIFLENEIIVNYCYFMNHYVSYKGKCKIAERILEPIPLYFVEENMYMIFISFPIGADSYLFEKIRMLFFEFKSDEFFIKRFDFDPEHDDEVVMVKEEDFELDNDNVLGSNTLNANNTEDLNFWSENLAGYTRKSKDSYKNPIIQGLLDECSDIDANFENIKRGSYTIEMESRLRNLIHEIEKKEPEREELMNLKRESDIFERVINKNRFTGVVEVKDY